MNMFGSRIKEARIQKGLTQRQLAAMIGAKHNSISDWENDKNKPDPDTIESILGALDITANYLFGWDNPEQIKKDAEELADKIISNNEINKVIPAIANLSSENILDKLNSDVKVKEILSTIVNLSNDDLDLVMNFVKRLAK